MSEKTPIERLEKWIDDRKGRGVILSRFTSHEWEVDLYGHLFLDRSRVKTIEPDLSAAIIAAMAQVEDANHEPL